jgi:prophage regulatory protein
MSEPRLHAARSGSLPSDETPHAATTLRLLRFPAVLGRTGLSRSTIWRLERRGAFPRHRRISPNAVAWLEQDVTDWIRSKVDGAS